MSSILETIIKQRIQDVEEAKQKVPLDELKSKIAQANIDYPVRNLFSVLEENVKNGKTSIISEVKRASPSKGDIAANLDAVKQGLIYAEAGATAISCLTEPKWFKGTLDDLNGIRKAISFLKEKRPPILRKDFIIDEYQVWEARVYGADTLLIIVAAFPGDLEHTKSKLHTLIQLSRQLDMEPLVEVNSSEEMKIALEVGAKVIGINNRNLHTFNVDLNTTTRIVQNGNLSGNSIICALSGIFTRDDVAFFESIGVRCVLVGEALMKASDPKGKINELLGKKSSPIVKICGISDEETALAACKSGVDMIGLMFAQESKRKVSVEKAKAIVDVVHKFRGQNQVIPKLDDSSYSGDKKKWFESWAQKLRETLSKTKPLLIGVFADQDPTFINQIAQETKIDIVQLSGYESLDIIPKIQLPVMKAVHVGEGRSADVIFNQLIEGGGSIAVLLDTMDPQARGGTGKPFDWNVAQALSSMVPFFLAGGLNPSNVNEAIEKCGPLGIDVSSGVETDGKKDISKIEQFISNAKK